MPIDTPSQSNDEFVRVWRGHADFAEAQLARELALAIQRRSKLAFLYVAGRLLQPWWFSPILAIACFKIGLSNWVICIAVGINWAFHNWSHHHRRRTEMLNKRMQRVAGLSRRSEEALRAALSGQIEFVLVLRDFHTAAEIGGEQVRGIDKLVLPTFGDPVEQALQALLPKGLKSIAIYNDRDHSGGLDDENLQYVLCSRHSWEPTVLQLMPRARGVFILQRGKQLTQGLAQEMRFLVATKMRSKPIWISHNRIHPDDPYHDSVGLQLSEYDVHQSTEHSEVREKLAAQIANVLQPEQLQIRNIVAPDGRFFIFHPDIPEHQHSDIMKNYARDEQSANEQGSDSP